MVTINEINELCKLYALGDNDTINQTVNNNPYALALLDMTMTDKLSNSLKREKISLELVGADHSSAMHGYDGMKGGRPVEGKSEQYNSCSTTSTVVQGCGVFGGIVDEASIEQKVEDNLQMYHSFWADGRLACIVSFDFKDITPRLYKYINNRKNGKKTAVKYSSYIDWIDSPSLKLEYFNEDHFKKLYDGVTSNFYWSMWSLYKKSITEAVKMGYLYDKGLFIRG